MRALLGYEPRPEHLARLQAAAPRAELAIARSEAEAQRLIVDADAYLGNRYFLQSLPGARRLRWMQSASSGVDLVLSGGDRLSNLVVTATRGVYDDEVADHAVALVLALRRGLHHTRDAQHRREWMRRPLASLAGSRALVLGLGGIGTAISRRLDAFGVGVVAVRRRPELEPDAPVRVVGPDAWRGELGRVDHLVLALPHTPATDGLVGAAELAALPDRAVVVNVGRGETLDANALLAAVGAGSVAGAALDVFDEEPLPPEHPLWREPNVLVTPHVGRSPEAGAPRWEPLFEENLGRFVRGVPLLHVVDQEAGY